MDTYLATLSAGRSSSTTWAPPGAQSTVRPPARTQTPPPNNSLQWLSICGRTSSASPVTKQVHSDGAAYCSESCRLATTSGRRTPSSQGQLARHYASMQRYPWSTLTASTPPSTRNSLHLSPPFDFGSHSRGQPTQKLPESSRPIPGRLVGLEPHPSSSHSSL
ncbi:hypothetical protein G6O67_008894 [Ophiocordyceps sinensis]|uniref:Uncharacterized protein n=1 Tax=Ophiocordyceps sinensis TaxID=72228 RepID=A0A8H4PMJ9_9HYPO|nr:hypothetical protein G6O67_008894 [Ophiocordyceps sinensis]